MDSLPDASPMQSDVQTRVPRILGCSFAVDIFAIQHHAESYTKIDPQIRKTIQQYVIEGQDLDHYYAHYVSKDTLCRTIGNAGTDGRFFRFILQAYAAKIWDMVGQTTDLTNLSDGTNEAYALG
jgi:hypothetical protein